MKNNILKYLIITIFVCVTIYYDEEIALCSDMGYECEDTNDYLMSEAQKYAVENAERHVETFIKLSAAGYAMLDTEGTYYLGRGYYTFTLEENKISRGEIINFQVIQYDRIVLILQIYKKDDEWHCNATTGGVDLLNEYGYITSIPCVVYAPDGKYLVDDGEVISFEEHNICTEVFTSDQMAELHYNYIKSRGSVLNKADYMCEIGKIGLSPEEYEINSSSSVEGFSIYTDTYQLCYDGKILIYWDSQTEEIMTTEYTGARTFIVVTVRAKNQKTGKYEMQERLFRWVSSIMIPLN